MGTEAQPTQQPNASAIQPAAIPPVGSPPATPAPQPAPEPAKVEPAKPAPAATAPTTPPVPERVPTRRLLSDTDDEIPNDAELLEMSPRALKSRLDRFTKKQLKERFGVEDFDTIRTQLDELELYKREREEKRLAEMTELDRLKEQLAQAQEATRRSEAKALAMQEARVVEHEDRRVMAIAAKYLDEDYIDTELPRLARYIQGCSEEELRDADGTIEAWFRKRVEDKPKLGRDYSNGAPPPAQVQSQVVPPKQVPHSNGVTVERPGQAQPSGSNQARTAAPGRPNTMTEAELREYKRQHNLHW